MDLLLHNLRTFGTHHSDPTVGEEAAQEIERLRGEIERMQSAATLARIAELEADAARYRWLREQGDYGCTEKDGYGGQRLMTGEQLDAAIDAARSQASPDAHD